MIEEKILEIEKLRKKLEESIINGEDYSKVYKISTDLDKLISEYYVENK